MHETIKAKEKSTIRFLLSVAESIAEMHLSTKTFKAKEKSTICFLLSVEESIAEMHLRHSRQKKNLRFVFY